MGTVRWLPLSLVALLCCAWPAATAQTIRAVTEPTPYTRLQDGKVVGSGVDVVEAVLKRAGLDDHQFEIYPWARSYDLAQKVPNVLLFMVARMPEREHLFKWVGDVSEVRYQFYKLRERSDIQPLTDAQMKRYSIGVKRDDVLQLHYQSADYPKIVVSTSDADIFNKLLGGQIDLAPLPKNVIQLLCRRVHFDCHDLETVSPSGAFTVIPYGLAFSKQTPDDIVRRAREALAALRAESALPPMVPLPSSPTD